VLISLCVAGLTAAAPQLDLPGVQRTVTAVTSNAVDEEALVSNVVTALEPSIALAVANALRSLQTTTTTVSDSVRVGGGAAAGFTSSSSSSSSSAAKSASSSAAAEKAAFEKEFAARQEQEPTTRPEYNFEFKVADSDEQTYITQQESRDGDDLTGSYSYVDPTGALITVNYQAGPDGFSQTTDKQEGFVQIVAKPPRIATASSGSSSAFASSSSSGSKLSSSGSSISSNTGAAFGSQATNAASASSLDQSALIAQILAALQPQISASVNAALSASQQRTQTVVAVPVPQAAPAPLTLAPRPAVQAARPIQSAASSGNLASLFGDGYAVRIATPEFKIEY
jgi:hypothetical protein